MKKLILFLALSLVAEFCYAQETREYNLIREGVALHDEGKFDDAIEKYKEALNINKNSSTALYEMALSYTSKGDLNNAAKNLKKVIQMGDDNLEQAYVLLGSIRDFQGDPKEAIKVYETGIAKFPNSNLLHYNLGVTAFQQGMYAKSQEHAIAAILAKPDHGSSHILLSGSSRALGQRPQAMLASYFFLLLEPEGKRSGAQYKELRNLINQGASEQQGDPNNIQINISGLQDDEFGPINLMVGMMAATRNIEENKEMNDTEYLVLTTDNFFSILQETREGKSGIWWEFYVDFFSEIVSEGHLEAFCYFISQSQPDPEIKKWLAANEEKVKAFQAWLDE
jgi:tetratricopeptide (TPR) repeat protein